MNKNSETEFVDINKENKYKNYIIIGILYVLVIILSILLVLGVKNQKDVIETKIEDNPIKEEQFNNENSFETEEETELEESIPEVELSNEYQSVIDSLN